MFSCSSPSEARTTVMPVEEISCPLFPYELDHETDLLARFPSPAYVSYPLILRHLSFASATQAALSETP